MYIIVVRQQAPGRALRAAPICSPTNSDKSSSCPARLLQALRDLLAKLNLGRHSTCSSGLWAPPTTPALLGLSAWRSRRWHVHWSGGIGALSTLFRPNKDL